MYTIRQAAARSGVSVALLRAWERRYGVVSPSRTPGGYRLYDDTAIARIRAMRVLVDSGWAPRQAAEAVLSGATVAAADGLDSEPASSMGTEALPARAGLAPASADFEPFVAAAMDYDVVRLETALDELVGRGSYEAIIDERLLPAVAALGTAWADGRLDVAAEHMASAAVQRRLAALFDLAGRTGMGHPVLVGLPPGCRHEIGTLAFAVALRRCGVDVLYLGPDTPVASWVHVAAESAAEAAVVGVPRRADRAAAREVVAALRAARPGLIVATGGPAAAPSRSGSNTNAADPPEILPARVIDAAATVARLVGGA